MVIHHILLLMEVPKKVPIKQTENNNHNKQKKIYFEERKVADKYQVTM